MRRGEHRGDDRIGHLILDDIGRLAHPFGVDDHLNVGDVRQRVERDSIERPDRPRVRRASTPKNTRKRFALHQSMVLSIMLLSSHRHGPLADTSICLVAI